MKVLHSYENGNYLVKIFSDGTKIRFLNDKENEFKAEFPENIDLKISNKCSIGCEFCHENSCKNGKIADGINDYYLGTLSRPNQARNLKLLSSNPKINDFVESLHYGTEVAIGGGALSELGDSFWNFL